MRFPIEVVTDRPEEIVEIGDVVAQLVGVQDRLLGLRHHVVGDAHQLRHELVLALHVVDGGLEFVAHLQHVLHAVLHVGHVQLLGGAGHADDERNRGVLDRGALRAGDGLHPAHTGNVEDVLGDLVDDEHVGGVPKIVIGFDHQHLGIHPGLREMAVSGLVTLVGRDPGGQIVTVVVARDVGRQRQQTDQGHRDRGDQDRSRPTHHRRADFPPTAGFHGALGVEEAEMASDGEDCGCHRQRRHHRDQHADSQRDAETLEVRQPGEV